MADSKDLPLLSLFLFLHYWYFHGLIQSHRGYMHIFIGGFLETRKQPQELAKGAFLPVIFKINSEQPDIQGPISSSSVTYQHNQMKNRMRLVDSTFLMLSWNIN